MVKKPLLPRRKRKAAIILLLCFVQTLFSELLSIQLGMWYFRFQSLLRREKSVFLVVLSQRWCFQNPFSVQKFLKNTQTMIKSSVVSKGNSYE